MNACLLCAAHDETVLWQDPRCRVILVNDPDYSGFCRVIWQAHIKEMTDLAESDRGHFMGVVFAVEAMLRELQRPDKINLASLGNQTPHLHWHVIPRYTDDAHFPNPVWSTRLRDAAPRAVPEISLLRQRLSARLGPRPA